jgi:succinyl-CoA synthetase alpha subunit
VALALTQAGLGQSIGINLGTDAMVGSSFREWLPILAADKNTKVIVLVSQTGSRGEAAAAEYIAEIDKPVIAYVAGRYAPAEKPLGDASTLTTSQMSVQLTDGITAQNKIAAFKQAKIPVAERLSQIPDLVKKALKK